MSADERRRRAAERARQRGVSRATPRLTVAQDKGDKHAGRYGCEVCGRTIDHGYAGSVCHGEGRKPHPRRRMYRLGAPRA